MIVILSDHLSVAGFVPSLLNSTSSEPVNGERSSRSLLVSKFVFIGRARTR
jgi:hypothetical protein